MFLKEFATDELVVSVDPEEELGLYVWEGRVAGGTKIIDPFERINFGSKRSGDILCPVIRPPPKDHDDLVDKRTN